MAALEALASQVGVLGHVFRKLDCEPAPMLGFILEPMMEEHLRRALLISKGDPAVFVTRPVSAAMLALSLILLATVLMPATRKKREEAFQEKADGRVPAQDTLAADGVPATSIDAHRASVHAQSGLD